MLSRSWLLYVFAAVLVASLAGRLNSNVAHAGPIADVTNYTSASPTSASSPAPTQTPTPSPSRTATPTNPASKFTPLMVLQPIGHRLEATAGPKASPLIVSVYQSGKEYGRYTNGYYVEPYGKIENGATYIGNYDSKHHQGEGAMIDGSIEVRLIPSDISLSPTGKNDDIYLLKRGTDEPCWFYKNALPKSPIKLYDTQGAVVVWIDTHYPINEGDCKH